MNYLVVITVLCSAIFAVEAYIPGHFNFYRESNTFDFNCIKTGRFLHPTSCTKFIQCDQNLVATEQDCPDCVDDKVCLDSKLHYNDEAKTCKLPVAAHCPWPTSTTTTTTTEPTTTDSGKTPCEVNCMQTGFCACYDFCEEDASSPTGGYMVKKYCDKPLYWNPEAIASSVHGGSCDFWDNLSSYWQNVYMNQTVEECPTPPKKCDWKPDPYCDNKYDYLPEAVHGNGQDYLHLQCPSSPAGQAPLWWDQDDKTCGFECKRPGGNCVSC